MKNKLELIDKLALIALAFFALVIIGNWPVMKDNSF